jgi:hypothetical protein
LATMEHWQILITSINHIKRQHSSMYSLYKYQLEICQNNFSTLRDNCILFHSIQPYSEYLLTQDKICFDNIYWNGLTHKFVILNCYLSDNSWLRWFTCKKWTKSSDSCNIGQCKASSISTPINICSRILWCCNYKSGPAFHLQWFC